MSKSNNNNKPKTTNILLIGSNFLAAHILVRLLSFENVHVTVMDRKDPVNIINYNQDVYRIFKHYLKDLKYRDLYTGKSFGDPKRNIKLSFVFKDWVKEFVHSPGQASYIDIIINAGNIYDRLYANYNKKETMNVNIGGMHNLLENIPTLIEARQSDQKSLLIDLTSVNVYGDQSSVNPNQQDEITEDDTTPNPKDLLNYTLYTQENMIKAFADQQDLDYIILRLGTLCGEFIPRDSLVPAAVTAILLQKKEFEVYNAKESIELLDINDLGMTINSIVQLYKNGDTQYEKIVNQIYNLKSDETEPKTVEGVVQSLQLATSKLPTIIKDHGIKGIDGLKLKSPSIKYADLSEHQKPYICFDKPISTAKAKSLLGFQPQKPLIYSMLPVTVNYLLNYILPDFSDEMRRAFTKIFYLAQTPSPSIVDENVHNDVKKLIEEIDEEMNKTN
jgi:nucleoside-diphosphate-sugar epimerase